MSDIHVALKSGGDKNVETPPRRPWTVISQIRQKCLNFHLKRQDCRMETMTSTISRAPRPLTTPAPDVDAPTREVRRLSTLLEVSQALSGTLNLKASLHRVLEILAHHHGAVRGLVSVLQADGELRVQASDGITDAPRAVRYRNGEDI